MKTWLAFLVLLTSYCSAQDQLVLDNSASFLGVSVSDHLTIFESEDNAISPADFLASKSTFSGRKMKNRLENLDFTNSSFFILKLNYSYQ